MQKDNKSESEYFVAVRADGKFYIDMESNLGTNGFINQEKYTIEGRTKVFEILRREFPSAIDLTTVPRI